MSAFCQINKKCEKLNQNTAMGKSICVNFLATPFTIKSDICPPTFTTSGNEFRSCPPTLKHRPTPYLGYIGEKYTCLKSKKISWKWDRKLFSMFLTKSKCCGPTTVKVGRMTFAVPWFWRVQGLAIKRKSQTKKCEKYQSRKLTGACTLCPKLMGAAVPVAPALTRTLE